MLQISLLLMKNFNRTVTPIYLSVVCSLFPKEIFLTAIQFRKKTVPIQDRNLKRFEMEKGREEGQLLILPQIG